MGGVGVLFIMFKLKYNEYRRSYNWLGIDKIGENWDIFAAESHIYVQIS